MHTRMLIPLDGSKLAENVLTHARTLAGALDLPIDLLSVVERMDFPRQLACETMACEEIEKRMDELAWQYADTHDELARVQLEALSLNWQHCRRTEDHVNGGVQKLSCQWRRTF